MNLTLRFFFRSPRFKAIMGICAALLVIAVIFRIIGGWVSPQSSIAGAIAAPFQKIGTAISNKIDDIATAFSDGTALMEEIEALKEENERLTSDMVDYEKAKEENENYKEFLELKEQNPDFQMEPAMLTSRDTDDKYGSFTIDKGSMNGISAYDPVITGGNRLVGYISEVAPTYAKVMTVFNPELKAGAYDRRTRDAGILSGSLELAESRQTRVYNLPRTDSSITIGDYIVTAAGGLFPDGLLIGTVADVKQEAHDISVYAVIDPSADIDGLRNVMVLTYFSGQGTITGGTGVD